MLLSRYGLREWLSITLVCVVIGAGCAGMGWWWGLGGVGLVWICLAGFFRDPIRKVPTDLSEGTMLSPADGSVSKILRVDHHVATGGPAVIVRIFLSVLDVHINRSPCDGEVIAVRHVPGKYYDARREISAAENESNLITLSIGNDETIGVRQVSGAIARRIVCPLQPGDRLTQGQKFGMIKFGSTTELVLPRPDDVVVLVAEGDKVRAGLTLLARLKPKS